MDYILYFFFFSFSGWILETVYASLKFKRFISKQTLLSMPLCPIYGVGAVLMIVTLSPVRNSDVLVFSGGFFVASAVEYLVALFYERHFGIMWWDYRKDIGNLNGKVCVKMSLIWGVIAIFFFRFILPFTESLILDMGGYLKIIVSAFLISVFAVDYKNTLVELKKYSQNTKSLADGRFWSLKLIKNK